MEIGIRWGAVGAIFGALFVAGFLYNLLVGWLEKEGYAEGYTAFMVVVGTLLTLGAVAIVNWRAAALCAGAFAFSGFWMIVGSWWRHVRARRAGQDAIRREVRGL